MIGTSASYITQLFRGNKIINLETIAKFQKIFDIKFEIKAVSNIEETKFGSFDFDTLNNNSGQVNGFWVYHNLKPDYKNNKFENIVELQYEKLTA